MTGLDLIRLALVELNVQASGEPVDPDVAQDGLQLLNDMIDLWSTESLMIFTLTGEVFPLQAGKQSYTMGLGGDFNTERPVKIENITITDDVNNPTQPLELPIRMLTTEEWASIAIKNISSQLPGNVYDTGDFPLRILNYYYIPQIAIKTTIYSWDALDKIATPNDDLVFPPGYAEALRTNLALRLAPHFPANSPSPITIQLAIESKARLKALNTDPIDLKCDAGVLDDRSGFQGAANRALFISGQ